MNRAPANTAIAGAPNARQDVPEQAVAVETIRQPSEKPEAVPDPKAGGSYTRDPNTGDLTPTAAPVAPTLHRSKAK